MNSDVRARTSDAARLDRPLISRQLVHPAASVTKLGGLGSNMMNRLSVDDTRILTSTFLGTTPERLPVVRNAPGVLFGLSAQGGVFWELAISQTVYLAKLTT